MQRLYFAKRTKEGSVEIGGGGEAVSAWDIFREQWARTGLPLFRIRALWAKLQKRWAAERKEE